MSADSHLWEGRIFRIELQTKTPFGIDRIQSVNFQVDRTIHINAMIVEGGLAAP